VPLLAQEHVHDEIALAGAFAARTTQAVDFGCRDTHDVTARKAAQVELEEREQLLRRIADAIPLPIVITRINQPEVLFANDLAIETFGLRIGPRPDAIRDAYVDPGDRRPLRPGSLLWDEFAASGDGAPEAIPFEQVAADHPLWILFSSGTTGLPKSMVQGHGGIVLEHVKALSLHLDLRPGDRFFWYTTTGWMMWNFLVGGLLVGATIVLYDGSPSEPDIGALWRVAERAGITYLGTSAPFIHASMRAGLDPGSVADLTALRAVGSTGAPLTPEGFRWVTEHVGRDVWLGSISGGTDLCTAVVGSCPWLPVRAGEIQCRMLGAAVEAFDPEGRSVVGEVGELVITEPMPSMPVAFWNDPDGERYRASYFEPFPGVWRHGDWITILPSGSCVISGRSDSTLNRGGVRIGTSELYRVVEAIPGVADALVVDTGGPDDEGAIVLFVVLEGVELDDELRARIVSDLRSQLSPRHSPDRIVEAPGVPMTLNGKRLEVPVKRLLAGEPPGRVASPESLRDPAIFRWYAEHAASLGGGGTGGERPS